MNEMLNKVPFLILMVFVLSCKSEEPNDLIRMNLIGKVKTIIQDEYYAYIRGSEIEKSEPYRYKEGIKNRMDFNSEGFIVAYEKFDEDGDFDYQERYTYNEDFNVTYSIKEDQNQNLIQESFSEFDDNWNLIVYTEYYESYIISKDSMVYDRHNNNIAHYQWNEYGNLVNIWENEFDKNGNQIKSKHVNPNEKTTWIAEYTYNKLGDRIQMEYVRYDGKHMKQKYSYDNNGNQILEELSGNDTLIYRIDYEFDRYNNLVSEKKYDGNNELDFQREYEYTFDNKGNWITRLEYSTYDPKKEPLSPGPYLERQIIYYQD